MAPYHGECLCGEVKVTLKEEPVKSVICYCTDCAKLASSPGCASLLVKLDDLQIDGQTSEYITTNTASGKPKSFFACAKCFTSVSGKAEAMPGMAIVKLGLFSTEDQIKLLPNGGFMQSSLTPYTTGLCEIMGQEVKASA